MKKFHKVKINDHVYRLPVMKISEDTGIAVFDMLSSRAMTRDSVFAVLDRIRDSGIKVGDVDYVLSAETKGILLAKGIADFMRCEMVILRKSQKPYHPEVIKAAVNTYTTSGEHYLHLDATLAPKLKGKRVLIVDDVLSTGSSLRAMEDILHQVKAKVVGKAFVFVEGDTYLRSEALYAGKLPIIKED